MDNCTNCAQELTGKFCAHCGQEVLIKRINSHYVMHEIGHVLHFERGILLTIRELLLRPGQNVKQFIAKDRSKLVKPVIFIIVTSLIYTLINHFFHVEDTLINFDGIQGAKNSLIFNWISDHYGYANIMIALFVGFWLKLFFRKYDYNIFELLILLCFVMGISMLIFSVFALLEGLTKINVMQIAGVIGAGYCTWAIGQFFDPKKVMSYVKALLSYGLGLFTFTVAAVLLQYCWLAFVS